MIMIKKIIKEEVFIISVSYYNLIKDMSDISNFRINDIIIIDQEGASLTIQLNLNFQYEEAG